MQRTAPGLRTDAAARLAALERERPEWRTWIALLAVAERELNEEGWRTPIDETAFPAVLPDSAPDTPLLNRLILQADPARLRRLVSELASIALPGRYRPSEGEAMRLVSAAVRQDAEAIELLAEERGIEPGALASVAHLAAFPLLNSWGQALESRILPAWPHGYCPVCAAWPIFAERRGLDRSRRLRCGRCASEWTVQWLYCIYCGERNHERLGALAPDEPGEVIRVETCASCRGYLKSFATLQGFSPFELLLQDLETVELDLVALDRGYHRPTESGCALDVQLVDHAPRPHL